MWDQFFRKKKIRFRAFFGIFWQKSADVSTFFGYKYLINRLSYGAEILTQVRYHYCAGAEPRIFQLAFQFLNYSNFSDILKIVNFRILRKYPEVGEKIILGKILGSAPPKVFGECMFKISSCFDKRFLSYLYPKIKKVRKSHFEKIALES